MFKKITAIFLIIVTIFISSIPIPGVTVKASSNFNVIPFDYYDFNDDWVIDVMDLAAMAKNYNTTDQKGKYVYDLNLDNSVDIYDMTLLSKAIGQEEGNTFGNLNASGLIAQKGIWRYFRNSADNGYLYKINDLSTQIIKVCNDVPLAINVIGDWIYYANCSDNRNIYKIRTDGSERTRISSDNVADINIVDNWIYYISYDNGIFNIYKIREDGSERTRIVSENVGEMNVVDDVIYYTTAYTDANGSSLYKIKTDGTGNTKICDDSVNDINYYDGYIYFSKPNFGDAVYKIKPDGSDKTTINIYGLYSNINVSYDLIFYHGAPNGTGAVCFTSLDGTSTRAIYNVSNGPVSVLGNSIYVQKMDNILYDVTSGKSIPLGTYPVKSVDNLSFSLSLGSTYTLPSTVTVTAYDNSNMTVKVLWDEAAVDTSTPGTHVYEGVVPGYPEKIKYTITIQ